MNKKEKRIFIYIAFAAALFALIMHLELVGKFVGYISSLIMPVATGVIMAFILNVPVSGFEKIFQKLFKNRKKKPSERTIHTISVFLSLLCIFLVLITLCVLVLPQLAATLKSIFAMIEKRWPDWTAILNRYHIDITSLKKWLSRFDWKTILDKGGGYVFTLIGSIGSAASSAISVVSITATTIIIAIYTLLDRDKLVRQTKKLLYAYTKPAFAGKIIHVGSLIKNAYTRFLTTQCGEALLLGIMITVSFALFRLPYAILIGAVTAICALIPYVGAFISCTFGIILTLVINPQKAVLCLIVYLAVQFIETQFIYPHVVGNSVGLSPLWTLIAILIGGKLFGLMGMIFFIPLISVVSVLIKEDMTERLKEKERKSDYAHSDS